MKLEEIICLYRGYEYAYCWIDSSRMRINMCDIIRYDTIVAMNWFRRCETKEYIFIIIWWGSWSLGKLLVYNRLKNKLQWIIFWREKNIQYILNLDIIRFYLPCFKSNRASLSLLTSLSSISTFMSILFSLPPEDRSFNVLGWRMSWPSRRKEMQSYGKIAFYHIHSFREKFKWV